MTRSRLGLLFIIIAVLAAAGAAWAQFEPPEQIVSSRLEASKTVLHPGERFRLTLTATVKDGCHIGAHENDSLYPAVLTLKAPKGLKFDEPQYPQARRITLQFAPDQKVPVYDGTFKIIVNGRAGGNVKPGPVTITSDLDSQACRDDQCYPPQVSEASVRIEIKRGATAAATSGSAGSSADGAAADSGRLDTLAGKNVLLQIVALYGMGLLLAFTPCILPMIPVTVGYFSGQGQADRRRRRVFGLASAYVVGLAVTYSALGAAAAGTGGVFGAAMQTPPVLIAVAAILIGLAVSMFGLYEIRPPAFIEKRSSGRTGVLGALVMGMVFGVVAAPCAGPVVIGLLLHVAKLGSPVLGFLMFFALALGLGTPLFALGVFSAKLPVPGTWMVAVKKVAGFLLLGAAAYFVLPIVPEPYGRYLIPGVMLAAGVYFVFFEKSILTSRRAASLGRAFGAVTVLAAVAMVWPGSGSARTPALSFEPYSGQRLVQAIRQDKPVMIDFSAEWCGVCRELEDGPFRDPNVVRAADRFVRLQVDGTNSSDPEVYQILQHYNIKGFPTIIFFDSSGNQPTRIVGYADSSALIETMKSVD